MPRSLSLAMLGEIAVLDQLIQMVLDLSARTICRANDVFDLDLPAFPRQFVDAQGKFGKLPQNFLLSLNPGLQPAFLLLGKFPGRTQMTSFSLCSLRL